MPAVCGRKRRPLKLRDAGPHPALQQRLVVDLSISRSREDTNRFKQIAFPRTVRAYEDVEVPQFDFDRFNRLEVPD